MIWLTWRQQRTEILIAGALLALLSTVLVVTGLQMADAYHHTGVAACIANPHPSSDCITFEHAFRDRFGALVGFAGWLNFVPLIFGLLFGAPFVLELEQGTYRLAWTQSITRSRWLLVKLGFIASVTLLVSLLFMALMTWWRGPFDHLDGSFDANAFDFEGVAPLSYGLFAVMLGTAVGTLTRKIVPALGISLAGYLAVRLSVENFLRPHFVAPRTLISSTDPKVNAPALGRQAWIITNGWSDRLGHQISDSYVFQTCPPRFGEKIPLFSCFHNHGIYNYTVFQPANRFWTFQAIETAIFLGITMALAALTVWWVRYRIS